MEIRCKKINYKKIHTHTYKEREKEIRRAFFFCKTRGLEKVENFDIRHHRVKVGGLFGDVGGDSGGVELRLSPGDAQRGWDEGQRQEEWARPPLASGGYCKARKE